MFVVIGTVNLIEDFQSFRQQLPPWCGTYLIYSSRVRLKMCHMTLAVLAVEFARSVNSLIVASVICVRTRSSSEALAV